MGIVADIMAHSDKAAAQVDLDGVITDSEYTGNIIRLLYNVQRSIGAGQKEARYVRAFHEELIAAGIPFQRGRPFPIVHGERKVGSYKVDFLIDDKLAVDIKVTQDAYERHFGLILGYLKYTGVKLALLACFREDRVLIKRIIYSPDTSSRE